MEKVEVASSASLGTFVFPNWQSFVWNYLRMGIVPWTGIHIQCSVQAWTQGGMQGMHPLTRP